MKKNITMLQCSVRVYNIFIRPLQSGEGRFCGGRDLIRRWKILSCGENCWKPPASRIFCTRRRLGRNANGNGKGKGMATNRREPSQQDARALGRRNARPARAQRTHAYATYVTRATRRPPVLQILRQASGKGIEKQEPITHNEYTK